MKKLTVMLTFGFVAFALQDTIAAEPPTTAKVGAEHKFLKQLAGEWDCDNEAFFEPGKPPMKSKAKMSGRMIGDFWVTIKVDASDGGFPFQGQGSYGCDSLKTKKYIGTWFDSTSPYL